MKTWLKSLLVFLAASVVSFGCHAGAGFLLDDYGLLCTYRIVGPFGFNYRVEGQSFFRPVTMTGVGLIWRFFGENPDAFLAARIVCLSLVALCIWGIWPYLFPRVQRKQLLLAPLLFIVWPNHGEVMGWLGGLPDLLAAALAMAALWCWLSFPGKPGVGKALLGSLFILAAFAAKESCLPILLAIPAFGWLSHRSLGEPTHRWWKTKTAWVTTLAPVGAFLVFMAYRTHLLGQLVGGYGHKSLFNGSLYHLLSTRGTIETANMFFPFARVTAGLGAEWSAILYVTSTVWLGLLGLAYTWPRKQLGSRVLQIMPAVCLAVSVVWIAVLWLDELASLVRDSLDSLYLGLILLSVLGIAVGIDLWMTEPRFLWMRERRFPLLASQLVLGGLIYRQMSTTLDILALSVLLLAAFWSSRPVDAKERDPQTHLFVVLCIALSISAIFIILNLPVGWDGQQERFSFFGSIFSTMAIASAVQTIGPLHRRVASYALLTACFVCMWYGNIKWFRVGRIAAKMSEIVRNAKPSTNIYVLAAPGVLDGAGLYQIGLDQMPLALKGDSTIKVGVAYTVDTFNLGDAYLIEKQSPDTFRVQLRSVPSPLHTSILHERSDPLFADDGKGVRLVGRKPGDLVYVISQKGPIRFE